MRPAPSDPDRRLYDETGYLVVKRLFVAAELEVFVKRFLAIVNEEVPAAPRMLVMRDVMVAKGAFEPPTPEHAICKINFFENDPELMTYGRSEKLLDCVESLLGPELLFVNSMVVTKPPGVDGRHPLHQDLLYFGFRPGDAVVGTWTALEPVTRANGCLSVLPGSHRGELQPHEYPDWEFLNAAFVGVRGVGAAEARVHLEMEPGDTLLFHSLLIHGSGTNKTQGFRRAISAHYARADAEDTWHGTDRLAARPWLPVRKGT